MAMARFFYKCLGRFALMTAAALWAGCGNDAGKKDASDITSETKTEIRSETDVPRSFASVAQRFVEETQIDSGIVSAGVSREYGLDDGDSSKTFDELVGLLRMHIPKIKKIYKSYNKYDARAQGFCLYKVEIGEDGSIQDILLDRTNIKSKEFVQAVQKHLKKNFVLKSELKSATFDIEMTFEDEVLSEELPLSFDGAGLAGCLYGCSVAYGPQVEYPDFDYTIEKGSALGPKQLWKSIRNLKPVYEKHLRNNPNLEGKIELKVVILPNGYVTTAEVLSSTMKSKKFDKAIVDAAKHWLFPKSFGTTTVSFPVEFRNNKNQNSWGGRVTKARGSVKKLNLSDLEISSRDSLDGNLLLRVFNQRIPGLRHIYNKHLKNNPGVNGRLVLQLTISPDGSITNVVIKSSTTGYNEFDSEIKKAVSRWRFEKSNGSTTVTVPFEFSEMSEK